MGGRVPPLPEEPPRDPTHPHPAAGLTLKQWTAPRNLARRQATTLNLELSAESGPTRNRCGAEGHIRALEGCFGPPEPVQRRRGDRPISFGGSGLNYWAAGRGPARVAGSARRSRLREFATAAAACLGQLWTIFESEQSGELDSKGAYRRLLELGDQYFDFAAEGAEQHDDGAVRWAALPAWLARTCSSRLDAAAALEEIATRPSGKLARPSKNGSTGAQPDTSDAEDSVARGPVLYVAVINQVKGMEFDHVIILALDPGRFPYGGEDCEAERCRWWVALSRAIKSAAYLGVPGNDLYWAERHDIEHQSTSHAQRRAAG